MPLSTSPDRLADEHTEAAIGARIASATQHSYLGDFVLGAVDGTITTFALVAGVAGADLRPAVAIVLGMANLLADGISMAVGNYLNVRSSQQLIEKARRIEEIHIERVPEGEREEIRQIFQAKGFEGPVLDEVVEVITRDHRRWVDTMITDELGLPLDTPSALRAGATTFIAFLLAGTVPLLPYFIAAGQPPATIFRMSAAAAGVTFFCIGVWKGMVVHRRWWLSGLETFGIGSFAALVAYGVGVWLKGLVG